jgi:hypothetical protein
MPLLLRHLMPLIVIAGLFVFSLLFVLTLLTLFGRLFRRPDPVPHRGPTLEGTAKVVEDASPAGGRLNANNG